MLGYICIFEGGHHLKDMALFNLHMALFNQQIMAVIAISLSSWKAF